MKVTDNFTMTKRAADGAYYGTKGTESYEILKHDPMYSTYKAFYDEFRNIEFAKREEAIQRFKANGMYTDILGQEARGTASAAVPTQQDRGRLIKGLKGLMDFFSEWSFTPSFRFVNTFAAKLQVNYKAAKEYVANYFALMDSSYKQDVIPKMDCVEFNNIMDNIKQYGTPTEQINKRLKIYFGPAGTGKTTGALKETKDRCIICNSSMLPSDIMEDFSFDDGKAAFHPSSLWKCMEAGESITLDEINLLPFDTQRFLQGLLDNKTEFEYKGRVVHIKDGFQIIGTMNLMLGGMSYGLPEPLVDRCLEIKKCELTAEQLAKAIMGTDGDYAE